MIREPVLECAFFIPIRRDAKLSDGKPHKRDRWPWLSRQLFERFEGCTTAPEHYEGVYRDPDTGERVTDESRRYLVAIPESKVDDLRSLLSECCTVFQQKCIYLSVAGYVEFVEAPKDDSS